MTSRVLGLQCNLTKCQVSNVNILYERFVSCQMFVGMQCAWPFDRLATTQLGMRGLCSVQVHRHIVHRHSVHRHIVHRHIVHRYSVHRHSVHRHSVHSEEWQGSGLFGNYRQTGSRQVVSACSTPFSFENCPPSILACLETQGLISTICKC